MSGNYSTWFDNHGLLHLNDHPHPLDSENGPLFSAYFYCLWKFRMDSPHYQLPLTINTVNPTPGLYRPSVEGGEHFSHDNMTGLYSMYYLFIGRCPKHLATMAKYVKHPRDICFNTYAKIAHRRGVLWTLLQHLLLVIPALTMMITCYQKYKVRGGRKILKTDGKLMTFLRCHTFGLKKTLRVCEAILHRRSNFKHWGHVFSTYFTRPNHPCNRLSSELGFSTWRAL